MTVHYITVQGDKLGNDRHLTTFNNTLLKSEVVSKPCQTSKIERFAKNV